MQWNTTTRSISFKVSGCWSCDAGRWPVSKVKKNISRTRGECLNICRFELYHAGEIEIHGFQTTLFSVCTA